MMQKVIVIVGPTAVGKTALSIWLAKKFGGEVVSADSRQVYRGLDIGSCKITPEEMEGVPHHLLDVADPKSVFSAAEYVSLGRLALTDIEKRNAVPFVVGGTGFYIDALLGRISPAPIPPNESLRVDLEKETTESLYARLKNYDQRVAKNIDQKNKRRLIRAIEIIETIGYRPLAPPTMPYNTLWVGLTLPIKDIRERVRRRIETRFEGGMLEEAKKLLARGVPEERMEALGLEYRLMARHLSGNISYDTMKKVLEQETVHYARRQMTWFKRNARIHWFTPDEHKPIATLVQKFLS